MVAYLLEINLMIAKIKTLFENLALIFCMIMITIIVFIDYAEFTKELLFVAAGIIGALIIVLIKLYKIQRGQNVNIN